MEIKVGSNQQIDRSNCLLLLTTSRKRMPQRRNLKAKLQRQAEREQVLNRVVQTVRQSLDLPTVFATATCEIAQLLHVDRATIAQYLPDQQVWRVVSDYHHNPDLPDVLGLDLPDHDNAITARLKQSEIVQIRNASAYEDETIHRFAKTSPGAWLLVPLNLEGQLWGGLTLMSNREVPWQVAEIELARQVADQVAIAIHQSQLYQQVQQLNADLEQQVQTRTAQLQLAYELESTLKRITDKVRDSLDEHQILQSVVEELTCGLGILGCNAALFDFEQGISSICYEYTTLANPSQRRVSRMADFPELYHQLLQGQHFQFCSLLPNPARGRVAILCCPIVGDRGVLGGLWLIHRAEESFSDLDIRLVQQVANQCAIALRQSWLYQAAQAQVTELERLNRLKDDFLSTVSHELRTPMASIKMAIEMLDLMLFKPERTDPAADPAAGLTIDSSTFQKVKRYFQFLQEGCQQEINLINNLLDLTRLDAEADPLDLARTDLPHLIARVAQPFIECARRQHQQLILDLPLTLPALITQPAYLERILTELLNNACKYTPAGETIAISARTNRPTSDEPGGLGHFNSSQNRRHGDDDSAPSKLLQLEIINTGVEIPIEEHDRIFDKFYRIPNHDPWRHGGTGLGLALVKKLVHRLGGTIQVQPGDRRTSFRLSLPL